MFTIMDCILVIVQCLYFKTFHCTGLPNHKAQISEKSKKIFCLDKIYFSLPFKT